MSPRRTFHLLSFVVFPVGGLTFILFGLIHPALMLLVLPYTVLIGILGSRIRCPSCNTRVERQTYVILRVRVHLPSAYIRRLCDSCGYDLESHTRTRDEAVAGDADASGASRASLSRAAEGPCFEWTGESLGRPQVPGSSRGIWANAGQALSGELHAPLIFRVLIIAGPFASLSAFAYSLFGLRAGHALLQAPYPRIIVGVIGLLSLAPAVGISLRRPCGLVLYLAHCLLGCLGASVYLALHHGIPQFAWMVGGRGGPLPQDAMREVMILVNLLVGGFLILYGWHNRWWFGIGRDRQSQ